MVTFPWAGFGLEGIDIESKVISKYEVKFILMMQSVTLEVVVAIVVIGAFLCLINEGMEVLFVDIMKIGAFLW